MQAVVGPELRWEHVQTPEPGHAEVRVRVAATAINRADLIQLAGHYDPPPGASSILGLECAGVIDAIGPSARGWGVGDRVACLLAGGGYAEQVVVPVGQCLPVPETLSLTEAAALPEVLTTAWLNLVREARLAPAERVLVHAGASGVGTAAIQICRERGNPCFVTAGSADKIARCVDLGATGGANRHDGPWAERVAEWTDGAGFDVILDPVGADYLADNVRSLATGGRMVLIGLLGGRSAPLDLGRVLVKRLRVVGSVLRARPVEEKTDILAGLRADVWPAVAEGRIVPIIDRVLPIAEVAAGIAAIRSNETVGKVVLEVP